MSAVDEGDEGRSGICNKVTKLRPTGRKTSFRPALIALSRPMLGKQRSPFRRGARNRYSQNDLNRGGLAVPVLGRGFPSTLSSGVVNDELFRRG